MQLFDFTLQPELLTQSLPLLFLLIVVAAIVNDDLTCVLVGVYVSNGEIPFWPSLLACFAGTLLGDLAWFLSARLFGRIMLDRPPVKWLIPADRLTQARAIFDRYGPLAIIVTRFLPGARTAIQIVVGLLTTNVLSCTLYFFYAAALYTPLLVGGSVLIARAANVKLLYEQFGNLALLAAAAMIWLVLVTVKFAIRRLNAR